MTHLTMYQVTDKCIMCGLCNPSCPVDAIVEGLGISQYPKMLIDPDLCQGCGICEELCPVRAIVEGVQPELAVSHENVPQEAAEAA